MPAKINATTPTTSASIQKALLAATTSSSVSYDAAKKTSPLTVRSSLPLPPSPSASGMKQGKMAAGSQRNHRYVDHSYTDYANVDEGDFKLFRITSGGNAIVPFPGKLLEVLDRGDLSSIIDWMPHGRAFIVKQPKVFATQVLPRFFKQTKFLSFTRQLNIWGFKRITRGRDAGAYYHERFLPGRPNLTTKMKRTKLKGTGTRPSPNPDQEPNFYSCYPRVAHVAKSRALVPLPPLSGSDGILASPTAAPADYHASQPNYAPPRTQMSAPAPQTQIGTDLDGQAQLDLTRAVIAAELQFQGSLRPGLAPSSSILGVSGAPSRAPRTVLPQESYAISSSSSTLDIGRASESYRRHTRMSEEAPQSFQLMNEPDEVSNANRRLLERLLDSRAPVPQSILQHTALPEEPRRPSFKQSLLMRASNEAHFGRTSAAPPSFTPVATSPPIRHDNFIYPSPCHHPESRTSFSSTASSNASLYSTQDYSQYLHSATQPSSVLPSSLSVRNQDINVHDALEQAQQLEEMARNQRAMALALADVLRQRVGRLNEHR